MKKRVGEGPKLFGAKKVMFNVNCASLVVKMELFKKVVIYRAEPWGAIIDERHKLLVMEVK